MRTIAAFILAACLVTVAAAAPATQLWAGTAGSGVALDSGVIDTGAYDCVLVSIKNTGSAVSGACVTKMVRNDGTADALGATFTVTNGTTSFAASVCTGVGTNFGFASVVPRRIQVTCAGAANAVLSAVIEGH